MHVHLSENVTSKYSTVHIFFFFKEFVLQFVPGGDGAAALKKSLSRGGGGGGSDTFFLPQTRVEAISQTRVRISWYITNLSDKQARGKK